LRRPAARNRDRNFRQAEFLRSQHATVAGDNRAGRIHQNRDGKTEFANARRQLRNLNGECVRAFLA
jgi:hypothetical protein